MTDPMSSPVPTSAIDVHTSFFPLAFLLLLFKPKRPINGAVYDQGRLGGNWSDYSILLSIFPSELAIPDAWATGLPAVLRSQP